MKTKIGLLTAVLFVGLLPVQSQRLSEEFTVATLNVDGLPTDVIGIPINSDGPGERYTPEIADYLLQKGYDIIGLQENFNYYDLLFPKMEADYQHDDGSVVETVHDGIAQLNPLAHAGLTVGSVPAILFVIIDAGIPMSVIHHYL